MIVVGALATPRLCCCVRELFFLDFALCSSRSLVPPLSLHSAPLAFATLRFSGLYKVVRYISKQNTANYHKLRRHHPPPRVERTIMSRNSYGGWLSVSAPRSPPGDRPPHVPLRHKRVSRLGHAPHLLLLLFHRFFFCGPSLHIVAFANNVFSVRANPKHEAHTKQLTLLALQLAYK